MASSDGKRKKNRGHFTPNKKQYSRDIFIQGATGFLITCNNKERGALAETYDLLASHLPDDDTGNQFDTNSCLDSAAAMKAEVNKQKNRKYKQVDTNVRNILFVRLLLPENPDPLDVMKSIFKDIEEKQKSTCRFICRMLPVQATCAATIESIEKVTITLLDKLYPSKDTTNTFMLNVSRRNCDHLTTHQIIESISPVVLRERPNWSVDFDDPAITVNIDILTKVACIALLPQMKHYRRYNLLEYAKKLTSKSEPILETTEAAIVKGEENKVVSEAAVPESTEEKDDEDESGGKEVPHE